MAAASPTNSGATKTLTVPISQMKLDVVSPLTITALYLEYNLVHDTVVTKRWVGICMSALVLLYILKLSIKPKILA